MNIVIEKSCNQSCEFCFANEVLSQESTPTRMELDEVRHLISFFGDQINRVNILGGEPTLHPRLNDIIALLNKSGRSITLITNGLSESEALKACLPYLDSVLVNYRHPSAYSVEQREHLADNMALFVKERASRHQRQTGFGIDLGVTFFQIGQDVDYLLEAGQAYQARSIRWDLSKPGINRTNQYLDPFSDKAVGDWLVDFVARFDAAGLPTSLDCPLPFCIFSSDQLEFMQTKVHHFRGTCRPPMDILPGLRAIHCFPLAMACDPPHVDELGSVINLRTYMYGIVRKGMFTKRLNLNCRECRWHVANECQGYCPALRFSQTHRP